MGLYILYMGAIHMEDSHGMLFGPLSTFNLTLKEGTGRQECRRSAEVGCLSLTDKGVQVLASVKTLTLSV